MHSVEYVVYCINHLGDMLDIKFIRENADLVKLAAQKKHLQVDVDALLVLDDERRMVLQQLETKKAEQNRVSRDVATATDEATRGALIAQMKELKESLGADEERLRALMPQWQSAMLQIPNIPDVSVPDGASDAENREEKVWGSKPAFTFEPKSHTDIMTALGMVDFERGTKVHGFRGYYLQKSGARLSWAIWNYAQEFFLKKGFDPLLVPAIVRKSNLYGTGHLPAEADDVYHTQDDDYLIGTAEVSTMGYYADEILDPATFPIRWLAFSPCFRREAGSHGKDTKGLIRVHEFFKLEQVILCEASHEKSVEWHAWLTRNTEAFIESLGIPYRTVTNCGGDLGLGQVKKHDIELWVPQENTYREIASASYFHDFQTRRFNIRYRDTEGVVRYAHSLNSTAIPTPRILVSLIENFQNADGSVRIPDPLVPYMGTSVLQ